jgi:hypothetical protein
MELLLLCGRISSTPRVTACAGADAPVNRPPAWTAAILRSGLEHPCGFGEHSASSAGDTGARIEGSRAAGIDLPIEETLRFLDDAISAGKIADYRFSNFLGWHVTKAVHLAKPAGWATPVTCEATTRSA